MLTDDAIIMTRNRSSLQGVVGDVVYPGNGMALIPIIDNEGNTAVTGGYIGADDERMYCAMDSEGVGIALGTSIQTGYPRLGFAPYTEYDSWNCNRFSDGFNRADGPMRSMPDYPWEVSINNEILNQRARGNLGIYWEENGSYPLSMSVTTYNILLPLVWSPHIERFGFSLGELIPISKSCGFEVRFSVARFSPDLFMNFWLTWDGVLSVSPIWHMSDDWHNYPTIIDGQVLKGNANGSGAMSIKYIGHSFSI